VSKDYFFAPRMASFAAFATRNLKTVLAGILIFSSVFGLSCNGNQYRYCITSAGRQSSTSTKRRMLSIKREICLLWNHVTI
jgi:hypothetical protein